MRQIRDAHEKRLKFFLDSRGCGFQFAQFSGKICTFLHKSSRIFAVFLCGADGLGHLISSRLSLFGLGLNFFALLFKRLVIFNREFKISGFQTGNDVIKVFFFFNKLGSSIFFPKVC
jgi:hypothetical protein